MGAENKVDISELIHKGGIYANVEGKNPKEIFENVCKQINLPAGLTADALVEALDAREQVLSTAVGNGISLPHARAPIVKDVKEQQICVVYLKNPIDMKAPDERLVHTMFILLTNNSQVHLTILSSLAVLFRNTEFRKALEERANESVLTKLIKEIEN